VDSPMLCERELILVCLVACCIGIAGTTLATAAPPIGDEIQGLFLGGEVEGSEDEIRASMDQLFRAMFWSPWESQRPSLDIVYRLFGSEIAAFRADEEPDEIRQILGAVGGRVILNGAFVFYYAGHGAEEGLAYQQEYEITPVEFVAAFYETYQRLWAQRGTPADERRVTVFSVLDCCDAGRFASELRSAGGVHFLTFAASREDEDIHNIDARFFNDSSFFTGCLSRAMREVAVEVDGHQSTDDENAWLRSKGLPALAEDSDSLANDELILVAIAKRAAQLTHQTVVDRRLHGNEHSQVWYDGRLVVDDGKVLVDLPIGFFYD